MKLKLVEQKELRELGADDSLKFSEGLRSISALNVSLRT